MTIAENDMLDEVSLFLQDKVYELLMTLADNLEQINANIKNKDALNKLENKMASLFQILNDDYKSKCCTTLIISYKKGLNFDFLIHFFKTVKYIKNDYENNYIPVHCYIYQQNMDFFKAYAQQVQIDIKKSYIDLNNGLVYKKNILNDIFIVASYNDYINDLKSSIAPLDLKALKSLPFDTSFLYDLSNEKYGFLYDINPDKCAVRTIDELFRKECFYEDFFGKKFPLIGSEIYYCLIKNYLVNYDEKILSHINEFKSSYSSVFCINNENSLNAGLLNILTKHFLLETKKQMQECFDDLNKNCDNLANAKIVVQQFLDNTLFVLEKTYFINDKSIDLIKEQLIDNIIKQCDSGWRGLSLGSGKDTFLENLKLSIRVDKKTCEKSVMKI